jgi:methyltransferase-like protein
MDIKEIFIKKSRFATRYVDEELVLVPVKNSVADMNELFTLNEVGSFIWENIDGQKTEESIANAVAEEFDVDLPTARNDVSEFISRLIEMTANC